MRGAARRLASLFAAAACVSVALALLAALAALSASPAGASPDAWARKLDGAELMADEPVWICDENEPGGVDPDGRLAPGLRLRGRRGTGEFVDHLSTMPELGPTDVRVGELSRAFEFAPEPDHHALDQGSAGGFPPGAYELRRAFGDTTRVLARFRVLAPTGSELHARSALARAARLRDAGREAEAARLYEAVLTRYPRTAYRTAAYWGLWKVRFHTRYREDPGRWLEEMFAHFHDTCFGVAAIDLYVSELGLEGAQPKLRKLVGLYPDTRMSRAAKRYL